MTTNYCVSFAFWWRFAIADPDLVLSSPLNARNSTGHRTRRSVNTLLRRWLRRSNSRLALSTPMRISPSSCVASRPSIRLSWAGRASRHSSSNACLPTYANLRSSSSSPSDPPATPKDSTCSALLTPPTSHLMLKPLFRLDLPLRAHTSSHAHTSHRATHSSRLISNGAKNAADALVELARPSYLFNAAP